MVQAAYLAGADITAKDWVNTQVKRPVKRLSAPDRDQMRDDMYLAAAPGIIFKHSGLEELFYQGHTSSIEAEYHQSCLYAMTHLHAAHDLSDCRDYRGFRKLENDRRNTYVLDIANSNVITFGWQMPTATDVDFQALR